MQEASDLLQELGFSEYEAKAYIALLQRNPLNGYELAKASGIPRANIYAVLQRLEERHAVCRLDGESSLRYCPVQPCDLLPEIATHYQHILERAQTLLDSFAKPKTQELSRNIIGYEPVLDQARVLINGAQHSLFIAIWYPESQALAANLAQVDSLVQITTLCLKPCPMDCGACAGSIYRHPIFPQQIARWLIVVKDDQDMLMGEISTERTVAIRTNQSNLIHMTLQYLQSQVAWAAMLDPNGTLPDLNPNTLRLLNEIRPHGAESSWLSFMRSVLKHDG
jgi:predicted transcriptional regulator